MSSRLFQEVRENRGLAYSIFSFASTYADTGLLGIYAGTGEAETAELIPVVCDELQALIADPGEEELVRARAQLKASLMMALESCFAQSEELARQLLVFGRRIPRGRDHRQDRRGRPGRDPPHRPPPADRRPARRSPRSARSPTSPTSTRSPAGCSSAGYREQAYAEGSRKYSKRLRLRSLKRSCTKPGAPRPSTQRIVPVLNTRAPARETK